MKTYSESQPGAMKKDFEAEVMQWPQIRQKRIYGHPCYQAGGKLFALVVPGGVVVTRLSQADTAELLARPGNARFKEEGWVRMAVETPADLQQALAAVRRSYERALAG